MSDTLTEIKPGVLFHQEGELWRVGDELVTNVATGERSWISSRVTNLWGVGSGGDRQPFAEAQISEGASQEDKIEQLLDKEMRSSVFSQADDLVSCAKYAFERLVRDSDGLDEQQIQASVEQMFTKIENGIAQTRRKIEYQLGRRRDVTYGLPGDQRWDPDDES